MHILDSVDSKTLKTDIPAFRPGDTVKVHVNIVEGNRSRVQVFQGIVLARSGSGVRETFTVRKVSFQIGVESNFFWLTPVGRVYIVVFSDSGSGSSVGRSAQIFPAKDKATKR